MFFGIVLSIVTLNMIIVFYSCKLEFMLSSSGYQDGAAAFGRRPGTSTQVVRLFTFLRSFAFSFYT